MSVRPNMCAPSPITKRHIFVVFGANITSLEATPPLYVQFTFTNNIYGVRVNFWHET
jgi:hypothetical protein